jgi:DNA-binding response OmpR family regulator
VKKILLVNGSSEDLGDMREFIGGFDLFGVISTARDGVEAIRKYRNSDYDVLIIDLELKKLSAWRILEEIEPCGKKIIVTSQKSIGACAIESLLKLQVKHILIKPFKLNQLKSKIELLF